MKQLTALLFVLCSAGVWAQDVIVKKDGSTILSKVLEVNPDIVRYKKFSNQKGPTYTIAKSEIMSINYQNGEKDFFDSDKVQSQNSTQPHSQGRGLIKKPADADNEKIIGLHNVVHPNFDGKSPESKGCRSCTIKFGIKYSSIMSNDDIEVKFVRKIDDEQADLCYLINIKNKTDKVLYIDKGNCFKVYNDGYSYCYFDASKQTSVNNGGGSGGSVNLGSIAGPLGITGTIGQIASGVNVGGNSSSSVSTTYVSQRFIAIPPHGNKYLTEDIWIGEGKRRTRVESPEYFFISQWALNGRFWGYHEFTRELDNALVKGIVNKNGTRVFGENELPWKREYFITYSTKDDFSLYAAVHFELFIQEIIGEEYFCSEVMSNHRKSKWFLNEMTTIGRVYLKKSQLEESRYPEIHVPSIPN